MSKLSDHDKAVLSCVFNPNLPLEEVINEQRENLEGNQFFKFCYYFVDKYVLRLNRNNIIYKKDLQKPLMRKCFLNISENNNLRFSYLKFQ